MDTKLGKLFSLLAKADDVRRELQKITAPQPQHARALQDV